MLINVLFDDLFDDCDIISVPDEIGLHAEQYGQKYCRWLESGNAPKEYYAIKNGITIIICETEGFVKWLNSSVCGNEEKIVKIIQQHTKYNPEYPTVEF